jgi:superoxide dismutase
MIELVKAKKKLKQERAYSLWIWLVYNKGTGMLEIEIAENQQMMLDKSNLLVPLLNIDLWEHAYCQDYKS